MCGFFGLFVFCVCMCYYRWCCVFFFNFKSQLFIVDVQDSNWLSYVNLYLGTMLKSLSTRDFHFSFFLIFYSYFVPVGMCWCVWFICMYSFMFISVWAQECTQTCASACGDPKLMCRVFLGYSLPNPLRQGLQLNSNSTRGTKLSNQLAPGIPFFAFRVIEL